ncbi:MAG: PaaI family thioesterase [Bacteroidales bacterium]|nr:PaaI family thioesterase [Bacteroidales bacterium]
MSVLINNPFRSREGYNCFGCSPDNPIGLKLQFHFDGEAVTSEFTPGQDFQGWSNVLHGGIQATVMDEIASWLVMAKLETAGVTSKMEVRLLKPALLDRAPFRMVATLQEMQRNIAIIKVELTDSQGQLCADSLMHYFTYPQHIAADRLHFPGIKALLPDKD